jgi:hypothetical protein
MRTNSVVALSTTFLPALALAAPDYASREEVDSLIQELFEIFLWTGVGAVVIVAIVVICLIVIFRRNTRLKKRVEFLESNGPEKERRKNHEVVIVGYNTTSMLQGYLYSLGFTNVISVNCETYNKSVYGNLRTTIILDRLIADDLRQIICSSGREEFLVYEPDVLPSQIQIFEDSKVLLARSERQVFRQLTLILQEN